MTSAPQLPAWLLDEVVGQLLTVAPTPAGVLDAGLRHLRVNVALARLYGVEPEDAAGHTPTALLGELGQALQARCTSALEAGRAELGHVVSGALTATRGDVWWQVDAMPLRSPAGSHEAVLLVVTDITARTRAMRSLNDQRRALAYQASHDPVTGLANRFQLLEVLQYLLSGGIHPGVLMVDLDGFKAINDAHGHAVGDAVLTTVATRLGSSVRTEDLVARYGGDEFVVVVRPDLDARAFAERLAQAIARPITVDGVQVAVGASIGVAVSQPGDSVSALLHRADTAMYRVKASRRPAAGG